MQYLSTIMTTLCLFISLGVTFNWLQGYAGLFTIAQATFMGLGAYLSVGIETAIHPPLVLVGVMVLIGGAIAGSLLGATAVRISGIYLVIASFGVQEVGTTVFTNAHGLTGGAAGVPLPAPFQLGGLGDQASVLVLAVIAMVVLLTLSVLLARSRWGLVVRAIRLDESAAQASGWRTSAMKVVVHAGTLGVAALVGMFYAMEVQYLAPDDFALATSIQILAIVAIGGIANSWGPVLGGLVAVGIPQLLIYLPLPSSLQAPLQQLIYGVFLVVLIVFRRNGILNEDYRPRGTVGNSRSTADVDVPDQQASLSVAAPGQDGE